MKLPAFLYGTHGEVKKKTRRIVTKLRRGVPWAELADETIDTRDVPGMIYVNCNARTFYGEHFFAFMPAIVISDAVHNRLPGDSYVTLFEPAISTLWGFMALLGSCAHLFFLPDEHMKRFLHALVRYWDELDAEGERYSTGLDEPKRLWPLNTMIHYCLINLGLPKERSYAPLPPGGIRELVDMTEARLH